MKSKLKMFLFLVILGFTSPMLFSYIDWEFYGECLANGMIPSFSNADRACTRLFENTIPQVFALCEPNRDWQDAPCSDWMPVNRQEFKKSWAAFYDYKGADWMESKKIELLDVIANGTFHEWDHSHENSNVYMYYLSIGQIPNQYEYFFFEDEIPPDLKGPLILIGSIIGGISATVVFVIRRIRK